jgi:hypothetical protein
MGWRFGGLKIAPKIEYLENSQVLAEAPKGREKAAIQCLAQNLNELISRAFRRDH